MKTDRIIKPFYIPIKCVVCNGFGTVNWGKAECHACMGKGYILLPSGNEKQEEKKNDKNKK